MNSIISRVFKAFKSRILIVFRLIPSLPLASRLKWGMWFIGKYSDWLSKAVFIGIFDQEETAVLKKIVQPGWCIIDIGAHYGYYTLMFSEYTGTSGKVFSFEPDKKNRKLLEKNLKINSAHNVQVYPLAVTDFAGSKFFYLEKNNSGGNTLNPLDGYEYEKIEVEATTLDHFYKVSGSDIHLIKLDIENAEFEALSAGKKLIGSCRPLVMLEYWGHLKIEWEGLKDEPVIKFFHENGYRIYTFTEQGKLTKIPYKYASTPNILAIPKEKTEELHYIII